MSEPERLSEIISRRIPVGAKKGKQGKLSLERIKMGWDHIAGERLAEKSEPTRITRGTLTVAAEGSAWAAEVSIASKTILRNVETVLGGGVVKKLKVKAKGDRAQGTREEREGTVMRREAEVKLSGELRDEIERLDDEEIREALTGLLKASMANRGPDESI